MPAALDGRAIGQRQRRQRIDTDVNILPTIGNDDAEAEVSAEKFLRRDPQRDGQLDEGIAGDVDICLKVSSGPAQRHAHRRRSAGVARVEVVVSVT